MPYFVYILECSDGSYYTGITQDVEKRLSVHKSLSNCLISGLMPFVRDFSAGVRLGWFQYLHECDRAFPEQSQFEVVAVEGYLKFLWA